MKHYKPIPIFDQAKSSDQGKPIKNKEEWETLLKKALELKPEIMDSFFMRIYTAIGFLPPAVIYERTMLEMEFLKKEFPSQFETCVEGFKKVYQSYIDPPPRESAEIIPFQGGGDHAIQI
jgi:hypothetical protein